MWPACDVFVCARHCIMGALKPSHTHAARVSDDIVERADRCLSLPCAISQERRRTERLSRHQKKGALGRTLSVGQLAAQGEGFGITNRQISRKRQRSASPLRTRRTSADCAHSLRCDFPQTCSRQLCSLARGRPPLRHAAHHVAAGAATRDLLAHRHWGSPRRTPVRIAKM